MAIKGFLFDLDGVLTDTSEFHYRGWQRLADELGLPFNRQDNEALRGVSRRESLLLMLKGKPASEDQMLAWMERKNSYYLELIHQVTPADLLPGSLDLLQEMRSAGIKIAIASASKNAPEVVERLQIASYVDAVVDGNQVTVSKPAPDLFLEAARQVGLPPAVCVVVEDAEAGVAAGLAAGMRVVGLGPPERVGRATLVAPSLEGLHLAAVLEKLGE
jgi:beta-phosphoglucomutase